MTAEERTRLLKEGDLYHVTLQANLGSILAKGLSPEFSDPDMYCTCLERSAVFLSTAAALREVKRMFDNGIDRTPRIVLKVAVVAALQHECGVDISASFARGMTFTECLEQVGFIACYGAIPPHFLEVVEHQDEFGNWQLGE